MSFWAESQKTFYKLKNWDENTQEAYPLFTRKPLSCKALIMHEFGSVKRGKLVTPTVNGQDKA